MARVKPIEKIRATAYYFVFVSRNLNRIAKDFQVSPRTIKRWAAEPEWSEVLDACGYQGERAFEVKPPRDAERDAGDAFRNARKIYHKAMKAGKPHHKLAAITESKTGIPRRRIREWAKKYGWGD